MSSRPARGRSRCTEGALPCQPDRSGVRFYGSLPGRGVRVDDIVGLALAPDDEGYFVAGANGATYSFGDSVVQPRPVRLSNDLPVVAITGV
jgi:hypothetical protein